MPLTSRAKVLMGLEATAALMTSLLVIARRGRNPRFLSLQLAEIWLPAHPDPVRTDALF